MTLRRPITVVCPRSLCDWSSWGRSLRTNRVRCFHRRWHEENLRKRAALRLIAGHNLRLESKAREKTPAPTLVGIVFIDLAGTRKLFGFRAVGFRTRR